MEGRAGESLEVGVLISLSVKGVNMLTPPILKLRSLTGLLLTGDNPLTSTKDNPSAAGIGKTMRSMDWLNRLLGDVRLAYTRIYRGYIMALTSYHHAC